MNHQIENYVPNLWDRYYGRAYWRTPSWVRYGRYPYWRYSRKTRPSIIVNTPAIQPAPPAPPAPTTSDAFNVLNTNFFWILGSLIVSILVMILVVVLMK